MAKGIDTAAHKAALEAGGSTIAVLGGGPDIPYPAENRNLLERIVERNLVLSEYPFGTRPAALNLKKRNKTIVALSVCTIVVQTAEDGGAMNAFQACKDQTKPIFAIYRRGSAFTGNRWILDNGGVKVDGSTATRQILKLLPSLSFEKLRNSYRKRRSTSGRAGT